MLGIIRGMAKSTGTKPQNDKPQVDWERIELDYRAGVKSLREIAEGSGTSHVNIAKRAKAQGWVRDLTKKIEAKANELVNKASVNSSVNSASPAAERVTVEAVASTQATIRLAHRADIERTRRLCMGMLTELEQQSADPALITEAADILRSTPPEEMTKEKRAKLAEAAAKAGSLQARSGVMRSLAESLKSLIALERQAFGIREEMPEPPPPGIEAVSTKELLAVVHALKGADQ